MIGIYKIENLLNGNVYIGQSIDIEKRLKEHLMKSSIDIIIDRAIKKYGLEVFSFSVIDEYSKEELDEKEIYWIDKYGSYYKGYNATKGGKYNVGGIRENHSQARLTENDIKQIYLLLAETQIPFGEIAKTFGVSRPQITQISLGKRWRSEEYIYPLRIEHKNSKGFNNSNSKLTDKEVLKLRKLYVIFQMDVAIEKSGLLNKVSKYALKHAITGESFAHLPVYKKTKNEWVEACID